MKLANRDRSAINAGEAPYPNIRTQAALAELATISTLAEMASLDHGGSGPRSHDRCLTAKRQPAELDAVDVECTLGATPRVHLRRDALLRVMANTLEPARRIQGRLGDDYASRCPSGKISTTIGEDLRYLREAGLVVKVGSNSSATWAKR
jgi:hypothetical protein